MLLSVMATHFILNSVAADKRLNDGEDTRGDEGGAVLDGFAEGDEHTDQILFRRYASTVIMHSKILTKNEAIYSLVASWLGVKMTLDKRVSQMPTKRRHHSSISFRPGASSPTASNKQLAALSTALKFFTSTLKEKIKEIIQ